MNFLAIDAASLPLPAITVSAFAVLFVVYVYIMKAINAKKPAAETSAAPATVAPAPAVAAPAYTGPVLEGINEKEAAVVMAIISDKTGISLDNLIFNSIKLVEE